MFFILLEKVFPCGGRKGAGGGGGGGGGGRGAPAAARPGSRGGVCDGGGGAGGGGGGERSGATALVGRDERDALAPGPRAEELTDERAHRVAPAHRGQRRRGAVGIDRQHGDVALGREEVERHRQLVPALDLVRVREVDPALEARFEQRH